MIKYLILLSILSQTASAQDVLGLFDTSFSPLIEAEINKFDFQVGEDPNAPQGDFSFKKFRFIGPSTQATMDNASNFYDSKVYYNGDLFGFQGPAASFVYKLRDNDKNYFNTVEWISIEQAYLLMDENGIRLRGDKFGQKGNDAFIFGSNFNLECERHPDHLLNDGDGFLGGCLNYGSVTPLKGGGIGTEYHYYDKENKKIIDIKGFVSNLETTQDTFSVSAISADANFSDEVGITGSDITISCTKPNNILNVGVEEFVIPCMEDIQAKGNFLNINYFEDNDKMALTSPVIKSKGEDINVMFDSMKFNTVDSNFALSSAEFDCKRPAGDILEIETYLKGCLNEGIIKSQDEVLNYEFNQKDEGDEPLDFKMSGQLGQVEFESKRIVLDSPRTNLSVDEEVFVGLNNVKMRCQKTEGLEKFEAKALLEYCKKEMVLEADSVQIKDFADKTKPIVADVNVGKDGAISSQGVLSLRMDSIKLGDVEDLTLMKDVVVDCETLEHTDVFIPNDVIEACAVRGQIFIENLFTEDSELSSSQLTARDFDLGRVIIPEKKAKLYKIDIRTYQGKVHVKVGMRVLGIKSSVSFSGPVKWHKEKERLDIKVEKTRLPLGIKSKGILMYFLKKMLVAEMIEYKDDGLIEISL